MSTTESRRKSFGMTFPALNGDVVQQGHADYCAEHGHAKHTIDGVASIYCPRCGAVVEATAEVVEARIEKTFLTDGAAHTARRLLIEQGREVSLIAYDAMRDLFVFDVEAPAPAVDPEHHAERYAPELIAGTEAAGR